jgi:arylsulfatase/arylsulfatase A
MGETAWMGERNGPAKRVVSMSARSCGFLLCVAMSCVACVAVAAERPNVILIMTDDQGIGDFGATGNKAIETPNIDAMAKRSATMTTFYVSPVCSPTRACLMTGRYNYRTRCIDTYVGRSMMDPDETTLAELLSRAGYATGVFGKWHLGDCYPMRAIDQGFQEALVHRGGGLAQPSEPRENKNRYTNPVLFHNGQPVQTTGYCADVYFHAALGFIEKSHAEQRNFFAYIATNTPHDPFHDVPAELLQHYQSKKDELAALIVGQRAPEQLAKEVDNLTRIAAMITNVDQNVGKLFDKLNQLGITDNTLVMFLVDNGPNTRRYVGPRRGMKSEVHDGGIRSPLWLHWPARFAAGRACDQLSAHIDVTPTVLEACGVAPPEALHLDGVSLLPLLEGRQVVWPDRTVVIQSHRGDVPVRYHHFMIRDQQWKLLHASGFGRERFEGEPAFELYDMVNDPAESKNLLAEQPGVFQRLKQAYDQWFDDVSSTRPDNYAPPRIWIGTPHENPTVLTRQDWREGTWAPNAVGYWELHVAEAGLYDLHAEFDAETEPGVATLDVAGVTQQAPAASQATSCDFPGVTLPAGEAQLRARLEHGGKVRGVYQVTVTRR